MYHCTKTVNLWFMYQCTKCKLNYASLLRNTRLTCWMMYYYIETQAGLCILANIGNLSLDLMLDRKMNLPAHLFIRRQYGGSREYLHVWLQKRVKVLREHPVAFLSQVHFCWQSARWILFWHAWDHFLEKELVLKWCVIT